MTILAALFVVAVAALLARLGRRVRDVERQVKEVRILRHEMEALRGELDRGLGVTRAHLAAVAAGEAPEREVILRGAPFRDIQPADALALYEGTPDLFVLDVRTTAEFASGHIPNAHLIPVDELEDRLNELPARTRSCSSTAPPGAGAPRRARPSASAGSPVSSTWRAGCTPGRGRGCGTSPRRRRRPRRRGRRSRIGAGRSGRSRSWPRSANASTRRSR